MDIQLGKKYRDAVTGFVGTATGICRYLHSDASVRLEATVADDGKPVTELWLPIGRLVAL